MIFSWPPASMPGVIRRSTRFTPNSTQRSTSPGSSITTSHASCSAANRSSSSDLLFPCTTHDDGGIPAASAYFISPSVETSAPMPSSHRIFMIGTFGNALVPYTTVPSPAPRRHARAAFADRLLAVHDERRPVLLRELDRRAAADPEDAVADLGRVREQREQGARMAHVVKLLS